MAYAKKTFNLREIPTTIIFYVHVVKIYQEKHYIQ